MWESQCGRQNLQLEKGLRWLVEIMPGKTLTLGSVGPAFLRGIRFIYCPHKSWCCFLPSAGQWRAVSFTVYPLPPTHDTPFYRQISLPILSHSGDAPNDSRIPLCCTPKGEAKYGRNKKREGFCIYFSSRAFSPERRLLVVFIRTLCKFLLHQACPRGLQPFSAL